MSDPIRMVSVPVELAETPAIRNSLGLFRSAILCGEQWSDTCRDAYMAALKELDKLAILTAAPVREEGGAVFKCDQCNGDGFTYPNGIGDGHNLQEVCSPCGGAGGFDPNAPALATREEAPAEAGEAVRASVGTASESEIEAVVRILHDVISDGNEPVYDVADRIAQVFRAQPQAREEAQPVGLDEAQRKAAERAAMDAGAYSWRNCRLAMVEGDKIVGYPAFSRADMAELARLTTTPPAPEAEAEKLRVAVEALEKIRDYRVVPASATIWTAAHACRDIANKALAALQQVGRDRGR